MLTETLCSRCGTEPSGSFSGGLCVQCSADTAHDRPIPNGTPEPSDSGQLDVSETGHLDLSTSRHLPDTADWSPEEIDLLEAHREGRTVVINVTRHPNLLTWAQGTDQLVYCGRRNTRRGFAASRWRNPYAMDRRAVDERLERRRVIDSFREYLAGQPDLLADLPTLRGKILACWCSPRPCHCHVIAGLVDGRDRSIPIGSACITHYNVDGAWPFGVLAFNEEQALSAVTDGMRRGKTVTVTPHHIHIDPEVPQ